MRPTWPAGPSDAPAPVHLFAAHLTSAQSAHLGAFAMFRGANFSRSVRQLAEQAAWSQITGPIVFHVVHDMEELPVGIETLAHIRLHRAGRPTVPMPPMDARFRAFADIARSLRLGEGDCAFAVDISDVSVVGNLSALCERHPSALLTASDVCSTKSSKLWIADHARRAGWKSTARLTDFLTGSGRFAPMHNTGVIGGRAPLFERAINAMAAAVERHHAARHTRRASAPPPRSGPALPAPAPAAATLFVDMLALNTIALEWDGPLVSGFPSGPVSMPMWGTLCASDVQTGRDGSAAALLESIGAGHRAAPNCTFNGAKAFAALGSGREPSAGRRTRASRGRAGASAPSVLSGWPAVHACARLSMLAMLPGYFFAHKLPWATTRLVSSLRRSGPAVALP